jgi:GTP cyclohydrolase I
MGDFITDAENYKCKMNKKEQIENHIKGILSLIGEDVNREGLKGTPDRIARMYNEIFRGYDASQKPKITTFENGKDGITYENMIIDEGDFYSMCEHHMMPFFGRYWFAYIPNPKGRILGISKIGRVVDYCAAKLQIQERLVREIVDILSDALKSKYPPLGVALVMEGEHLCKSMRGAKKKGKMKLSYLVGVFKDDAQLRNEFFNLIK